MALGLRWHDEPNELFGMAGHEALLWHCCLQGSWTRILEAAFSTVILLHPKTWTTCTAGGQLGNTSTLAAGKHADGHSITQSKTLQYGCHCSHINSKYSHIIIHILSTHVCIPSLDWYISRFPALVGTIAAVGSNN
jgi:hypothetical protein